MDKLIYQQGFGNHFATEALVDALPQGQNSPQTLKYGLYAEQISGSAFTAPNHSTLRSWLYRIHPSVIHHDDFKLRSLQHVHKEPADINLIPPTQMRWDPWPLPEEPKNFIEGLKTIAMNGNLSIKLGAGIHIYCCNKSMDREFIVSHDGEWLIVPQTGDLLLKTELGLLTIAPEEIAIIPRGIKFQVQILNGPARGYILENYGSPFILPERGPIGANGLANERDFLYPTAYFEDIEDEFIILCKFLGNLWESKTNYSPLDVVAWHGNYSPYKYNLNRFNTINTVSFDHTDPSIFTVLTSPSATIGTANIDFVIFPERWQVAEHTFRPPYYHRNTMSEFMGLIKGQYDAKVSGFQPGGMSIHNCMSPHGPDASTFEIARKIKLEPKYIKNSLAFMFESQYYWLPTQEALSSTQLQKNYRDCWQGLPKLFH